MTYLTILWQSFKYAGLWGNAFGKFHFWVINLRFASLLYYGYGMFYYAVVLLKYKQDAYTMQEKLNSLYLCTTYAILTVHYVIMYTYRNKLKVFYLALEYFEEFGYPNNLEETATRLDRWFFYMTVYCGIATIIPCVIGFQQYDECSHKNSNNKDDLCGFTMKAYFPYDINSGAPLYLHLIIQTYANIVDCWFGSLLATSCIIAIEMIVIRLQHLRELLEKLFVNDTEEVQLRNLRHCIRYHMYIIKLVEDLNGCYSLGGGVIMLGYALTFAFSMMAFMKDYSFLALSYSLAWGIVIFVLCYSGQRLHDHSENVGNATFYVNWLNLSKPIKQDVHIMIMRSQKPLYYTSFWGWGKFILLTYKNIMVAAYQFIGLWTTLNDKL